MAVSRLISLFETLESSPPRTKTKSSSPISTPLGMDDSTSFSDFCLSLQTGFITDNRYSAYTSMASTPSSSVTGSPSSFRVSKRTSRSYSPFFSSSSRSRSPYLLRRQPSSIDIAIQDERSAVGAVGLGLSLMEPRPVLDVPISIGTSHIFDGTLFEEEKQPFVMGGIFETMEGTC